MNVGSPPKMATQAWQSPSGQASAPGQSPMAGFQGQWQPPTDSTQSQRAPPPLYNGASSLAPSPSSAIPQFISSNQANSESPQSQQPPTSGAGIILPQANAVPSLVGMVSGFVTQPPSFSGPRWLPPPPVPNSQTGVSVSVSQTPASASNSQMSAVPQLSMLTTPQGLSVPAVLPLPPGSPWQPQRPPLSPGPPIPGPSSSSINSAPNDLSSIKAPSLPPGEPVSTSTPAATQRVSNGLAVPAVALGASLPASATPAGLAPPSVSQMPINVAHQSSKQSFIGASNSGSSFSSMTSATVVPGPSLIESLARPPPPPPPPVLTSMTPIGTPNSATMVISPAISPAPPGVSSSVSVSRPSTLSSITPTATGIQGIGIVTTFPVAQQQQQQHQQHEEEQQQQQTQQQQQQQTPPPAPPQPQSPQQQSMPYLSVPPVPPFLPWVPGQPHQFPPFINVPNPFLPPIRPVVPTVAGNTVGKVSSDSTAPLAPPGEQLPTGKASTAEGDKVLSVSSLSGQVVNGQATTNASNLMSITSSIVTKSALGSDVSAKVVEVADVWTAHRTPEGIVYYYNSFTGQSTYDQPPGFQGEVHMRFKLE